MCVSAVRALCCERARTHGTRSTHSNTHHSTAQHSTARAAHLEDVAHRAVVHLGAAVEHVDRLAELRAQVLGRLRLARAFVFLCVCVWVVVVLLFWVCVWVGFG